MSILLMTLLNKLPSRLKHESKAAPSEADADKKPNQENNRSKYKKARAEERECSPICFHYHRLLYHFMRISIHSVFRLVAELIDSE